MSKDYPPYLDHPKPRQKQTNGDRLRAMSDYELAYWIHCPYRLERIMCKKKIDCFDCCLNWVKQPAEERA